MESFSLPFWDDYRVSVALFSNVKNASEIKQLVMKGEINAAFIKPHMIVDVFQVLTAATKALHVYEAGKMVTRAVHSEVLYSLSPNKNISDCFKRFGLDKTDTYLLVAEIHKVDQGTLSMISHMIQGECIPLSRLKELTDTTLVKKVYKVTDEELTVGTLLEAVVGRMASKEFVTF